MEDCSAQILGKLTIGIHLLSDNESGDFLARAFLLQSGLLLVDLEAGGAYYFLKIL